MKRTNKLGSKHPTHNDQQYVESEGEAGDARMYADRANGLSIKTQPKGQPLPVFVQGERSVFDMKMDHRPKF